MIIATAGHVDHGKTELVKALTGTDTDRLPEEKARGLSVDLGFAYLALPDKKMLGFVDVPGHEKFIRNMLAGVAGIDLALLVVAADDGVMPQTLEHISILNLLGIEQCLVVLTKIDRVPPARVVEVKTQLDQILVEAGRKGCDVFSVSAPKRKGIDLLKQELIQRAQANHESPNNQHFRMAIDRVFSLKGVGLVVTGMVMSGSVHLSESLTLSTNGSQIRIREIRCNSQISEYARSGERCALNIIGRGANQYTVRRGQWLMHAELFRPTMRIDVDLEVLWTEASALKHWTPTHLHIGSAHLPARVATLSGGSIAAGANALAQLVLSRDIFAVHGDRFVLRDQSAQRTIAGGRVIDPFPPKRGRAKPNRIACLEAMRNGTPTAILKALTEQNESGVPLKPFAISHNLPAPEIKVIIETLGLRIVEAAPNDLLFSEPRWRESLDRIEIALATLHKSQPSLFGASVKDIQNLLTPLPEQNVIEHGLRQLVAEARVVADGQRYHLPSYAVHISAKDKHLLARAAVVLNPATGAPPSLHEATKEIGVDAPTLEKTLKIGVKLGDIIMLEKHRFVPKSLIRKLAQSAELLAEQSSNGTFTTIDYRQEVNMGRNFVISVLDYFDRIGFTVKIGNDRRIRCSADHVLTGKGKG